MPRGEASINEEEVLLDDSQVDNAEVAEDSAAQAVASLQRKIMHRRTEARKAASQRRLAAAERAWDDWAVYVEMHKPLRYRLRYRSFVVKDEVRDIGTQTDAPGEAHPAARSSHELCPTNRPENVDEEDTEEWPPRKGCKRRTSSRAVDVGALNAGISGGEMATCAADPSGGLPLADVEMPQNDQGVVAVVREAQVHEHDCEHHLHEGNAGMELHMEGPALMATVCDELDGEGRDEDHCEDDVVVSHEGNAVMENHGGEVIAGTECEIEGLDQCCGSVPPGPRASSSVRSEQ